MWDDLEKKIRRKLNIIVFIVLPILMVLGFFVGMVIAEILQYSIDSKAIMLAAFGVFLLYLVCIKSAYDKAKDKSDLTNANSNNN
jgi:uncharacterized membrane protein YoaK (UPF0700 family)